MIRRILVGFLLIFAAVQSALSADVSSCGGVDDTAAIQSAIDATPLGEVRFPVGTCAITSTITVKTPTTLVGQGRGSRDLTGSGAATILEWDGAAGAEMVAFAPEDVGTVGNLTSGGVRGIRLDGNSVAGTCLAIRATTFAEFIVSVQDCTQYGVHLGYSQNNTGYRGVMRSRFDINGSFGGDVNGIGLYLDGTDTQAAGYNANFNYFDAVRFRFKNSDAVVIKNGDNNVFMMMDHIRIGGGTAYGLRLKAAQYRPARANTFFSVSTNIIAEGKEVAPKASYSNTIFALDKDNNVPNPVIGNGATLFWRGTNTNPF